MCVVATCAGTAPTTDLGCRTVTVLGSTPVGRFENATTSFRKIATGGWAIDGDTTAPVSVRVTVDGKRAGTVTANAARPNVARSFPGYGAAHGWSSSTAASPGKHQVCAVAVSIAAGADTALGCKTVTVPAR